MQRRVELTVRRGVIGPAELHHLEPGLRLLDLLGRWAARQFVTNVSRVEDKTAHSLRMAYGIGHADRRAGRRSEQDELLEAGGLDHRLEIFDELFEGEFDPSRSDRPQPRDIVADERVAPRQHGEPGTPVPGCPNPT